MQQKCLSEIDFDLIQLDSVNSECLGKLGGKKPSQAILHDLMKLAACAESVQFDLATFCRIYMEYMCAAEARRSALIVLIPRVFAICSYFERQEQERKQSEYNDG